MDEALHVLVAVSDPVMSAGVCDALEGHGALVVDAVTDGANAVRSVRRHRPEVCLLDQDVPGALDAAAAVRRASPRTAVLMFGRCESLAALASGFEVGACGYLSKDVHLERLTTVLRAAAQGERVVARQLVGDLVPAIAAGAPPPVPRPRGGAVLTEREQEVLALVAQGDSTAVIARRLYVAPVTVRTHVAALMHKLGVGDREALVRLVREHRVR